ncbi:gliding motility-associated C-terminal domain-containing protein [Saprospiraceae bacterium]|nr:gliding motility-associated C-terminal domain-containing protein [Saprospiraceae bacterium]
MTNLNGQVDKYNCNTYVPSPNDDCDDALLFSGTTEGITCCGSIGQIDLCGDMETSIWFIYDQALEGTVLDFSNIDITGPVGIEIYSGDCDNLTLLDRSDCSGLTESSFTVPNCNGRLYIQVSSKNDGCGAFRMTATDISGCNAAENCEDIGPLNTLMPLSDQGNVSLSSCLELSCNSNCTNQSVWFEVQTDNVATAMNLSVKNADFSPLISVRRIGNTCNDGTDIIDCRPLVDGEVIEIDATQDATYHIEISLADGDASAFDLCVNTIQQNIDCANATMQVIRREFPGANPDGPFCPGETVTFCYDLEFFVDARGTGNNCQWLQGIVPVLGGGWDLAANDLSDNVPNGWNYFPEGSVDFNVDHPTIAPTVDPLGRISLEYGPGGLSNGDLLPAGWWITESGTDPGCSNTGDPDDMWGTQAPCGSSFFFTHCFELTTRAVSDIQDCDDEFGRDLSVEVYVFADGQTGCYDNSTCTGDVPASFEGQLDCSTLLDIVVNDTEICSGEFVDLDVSIDGGFMAGISIEVVDESGTSGARDRIFDNGIGIIPDQIINTTGSVQTVVYSATLYSPDSDCPVPTVFFEVIVQPEVIVEANAPLLCEGTSGTIAAVGSFDSYEWYDLDNNLLGQEESVEVSSAGIYILQVTEGNCQKQLEVTVSSTPGLPFALLAEEVTLCNNDIGTLPTSVDLNQFIDATVQGDWVDESGFSVSSNVDFAGQAADTLVYQFSTSNANFPCVDTTYNFTINIENCACPTIDISVIDDQCPASQVLNLNQFVVSSDPGSWAVTDGPDVSTVALIDGEINIDNTITPGLYTFIYTLDGTDFGPSCSTSAGASFSIGQSAEAVIEDSFTGCNALDGPDPSTLDLDELFVSGSAGSWMSNDLSISGDNVIDLVGATPGDYIISYETSSAVAPCDDQVYTMTLTVNDCACEPLSLLPLMNQCQADSSIELADLIDDAGPGTWSISSSSAIVLPVIENNSQLLISDNTDAGTYELAYTLSNQALPANCLQDTFIIFDVIQKPEAELTLQAAVCNQDIGSDPDFIDLDDLFISGSTGAWTTSESSLTIDADNVISFAGQDVRDYSIQFTTNDAQAPCDNVTYDVVITVKDCACPSIVLGNDLDLCQEDMQIALDDLIVDADPGTWSIVAGMANTPPEIIGDSLYIAATTTAAVYEVMYSLSGSNIPASCATSEVLTLTILSPPIANVTNAVVVCNMDLGTLPVAIDIDTLFIDGSTGDWSFDSSILTIDGDNVISFDGIAEGVYTLTYTTNDAVAPCENVSYDVEVTVNNCACPTIDITDIGDLCLEDQILNLNDFSSNAGQGTWSNLQHNSLSNPPVFDGSLNTVVISEMSSPGDYTLTYTLSDTSIPAACDIDVDVAFTLVQGVDVELLDDVIVCNEIGGSFPSMVDIDTLFLSGNNGEWTLDGGLQIDADNVIDFAGVAVGSYELIYTTTDAQMPCQNESFSVNVIVTDCSCPLVGLGVAPDLCSSNDDFDLSTLVLNGVGAGLWSYVDGPEQLSINNNILLYNDVQAGVYTLAYTLDDVVPAGCDNSAEVEINISAAPELVVTPKIAVCNAISAVAPTCIDLTSYSSTQDGTWEKANNFLGDFSDITNICFDGIPADTELLFTFTTNNAQQPCDDVQGTLEVTVINCDCPDLSLENPSPLCTDGGILDLSTLETPTTVSGTWSFEDGPESVIVAVDNLFDAANRPVGIYTFRFTPDVLPDVLCDQFSTIEVQLFTPLSAGTGNVIDYCEDEPIVVTLSTLLDSADDGGTWEEVSISSSVGGVDSQLGLFDITNESPGIYEFSYSHLASATCPAVASKVIVVIQANPVADAGADFELTCNENTIQLGGPNMEVGPRIEYDWSELSGQPIPNATTANPIVTQPGTYTVRLLDNLLGCESFDTVVISEDRSIPTFNAEVLPISCDGTELGGIVISNSTGGNGDYSYSIDNGATWSDRTVFDNLEAGTYNVIIEDGNGCQSSVEGLEVAEPIFIGLSIGEDLEVPFGDESLTLSLTTIASTEDISIVVWEENGEIICEGVHNDCVEIEVDPSGVSTYCVSVTDNNGCEESACIVVTEVLSPDVYMANVFTPARSSFNNRIFVQADDNIELVKSFTIYDRWGEKVFVATPDHLPNDPSMGWDGFFNGDDAPTGVYTYFVEVVDVLGETRKLSGSVTLLR